MRMSATSCAVLVRLGLQLEIVQHGDVGARSQRFVTVMGDVVRRSWAQSEEAVRDGVVCLYERPEGTYHCRLHLKTFLCDYQGLLPGA